MSTCTLLALVILQCPQKKDADVKNGSGSLMIFPRQPEMVRGHLPMSTHPSGHTGQYSLNHRAKEHLNFLQKQQFLCFWKLAPSRKRHEAGMPKMDKKTHILAWKDEGVTSEKMAKHWGGTGHQLTAWRQRPGTSPASSHLPAKRALEDHVKWTRPFRQNSKDRSSSTP